MESDVDASVASGNSVGAGRVSFGIQACFVPLETSQSYSLACLMKIGNIKPDPTLRRADSRTVCL